MKIKAHLKKIIVFVIRHIAVRKVTAKISVLAPSQLLQGRTALVTGGTSGIGYQIAKAYITAGAKVVITGRTQGRIDDACKRLSEDTKSTGLVYGIVMDVTNVDELKTSYNNAIELIGSPFDILVNNAGVMGGDISKTNEEEFNTIIDTNIKGVFFLTKIFADSIKILQKEGNILNIASSSSFRPATSVYGITKWGIKGFTEGMARQLAPYGIVVNAIAPGPTATPMLLKDNTSNIVKNNSLIKRYIMPEEIANMAVILVSDMSRSIVGDTVCMTGGSGNLTNEDMNF